MNYWAQTHLFVTAPMLHARGGVAGFVHHSSHAVLGRLLQVLKAPGAPQSTSQRLKRSTPSLGHFLPSRSTWDSPLPRSSLSTFSPCPALVHHARDLGLDGGKSFWAVLLQLVKSTLGTSCFSCPRIKPHNLNLLVKIHFQHSFGIFQESVIMKWAFSVLNKTWFASRRAASWSSSYWRRSDHFAAMLSSRELPLGLRIFFAIKTTLTGLSCGLPNRFSSSAKAFLFLTSPHPHQEQCIIQGHDWDKVGHVYYSQSRLFTIQQCSPRWFTPFPVSLFACNRFDCLVDFVRVGGCHRCCPQVPPRRRQSV